MGGQPQLALLTRKSTSMALSALDAQIHPVEGTGAKSVKSLPKGNLLLLRRLKVGQLIRCITRKEVNMFLIRAERTDLANLGAAAPGIAEATNIIDTQRTRRKFIASASRLRTFDRQWAFASDLVAVHKMLLILLTGKPNMNIDRWNDLAQAAGESGAGLRNMLH
jgi:hypothetical protein